MDIVVRTKRKRNPNHEEKATRYLHDWFYGGSTKFITWITEETLQPDGSYIKTAEGWRHWKMYDSKWPLDFVWAHLKGDSKGVVAGTSVPFISVDLDRHGPIPLDQHIQRVLTTLAILTRKFGQLCWVAEVNLRNGSTKFYGFGPKPLLIDDARKLAQNIYDSLGQPGSEVFPYNCSQVSLPMRSGKATIIDTGILPRVLRRKNHKPYQCYSAVAFKNAMRRGHCNKAVLLQLLERSGDQFKERTAPASVREPDHRPNSIGSATGNAWERQLKALMSYSRQLKQVPTLDPALDHVKKHGHYSGEWRNPRRASRVRSLLKWIARKFDPRKCKGIASRINWNACLNSMRHLVGHLRPKVVTHVSEYGELTESRDGTVVDSEFAAYCWAALDFCFQHPNEDGSIPEHRLEALFKDAPCKWNAKKWRVFRDWLEDFGAIRINRQWRYAQGDGQAMKYEKLSAFDRLPEHWKGVKTPALQDSTVLENGYTHTPLNSYMKCEWENQGWAVQPERSRPPP
jgi:hypothetical protein